MIGGDTLAYWVQNELIFEDESANEVRLVRDSQDAEYVTIYVNDEEAGAIALERQGGSVSTIRWIDPSGAWIRTTAGTDPVLVDYGGWVCPPEICPEPEFMPSDPECQGGEVFTQASGCNYLLYGAVGSAASSIFAGIIGAVTAVPTGGLGLVMLYTSVGAGVTAMAGGYAYALCIGWEPE